jgi:hypothetical protein
MGRLISIVIIQNAGQIQAGIFFKSFFGEMVVAPIFAAQLRGELAHQFQNKFLQIEGN